MLDNQKRQTIIDILNNVSKGIGIENIDQLNYLAEISEDLKLEIKDGEEGLQEKEAG